ncbi:hypothetical protein ABEB36_012850 [Hypothenemus hampei]|uniref:Uncharacterized protein n=1 Tax=Hypothenemus hampei TaxID=57062 RepID=A0ABD1E686_HYPHA
MSVESCESVNDGQHNTTTLRENTELITRIPNRKRKAGTRSETAPTVTGTDKILSYLEKRSMTAAQQHEIDKTFLGYAASVKKLSAKRQTLIKFGIAKLIMEHEIEQHTENLGQGASATQNWCRTSYTSDLNVNQTCTETASLTPSYITTYYENFGNNV